MKQFLLILFSISALCAFAQPDTTEIKKLKYTNVKFYLGQKKVLKDVLLYDAWAMGKLDIYPAVADSLAKFLLLRKNIVIELGGHSNCANAKDPGTNAAKAVKDYLVTKGVPADRIQTHGYGNALPLVKCPEAGEPTSDTYANRRVEAKIVDFVKPSFTYQDSILYSGQVMTRWNTLTNIMPYDDFNTAPLDTFADFLKKYTNLIVEVKVHSEDAYEKYSVSPTLEKAKRIADYLISKGVKSEKIMPVGMENKYPITPCTKTVKCSEEERLKNRRVEFVIIRTDGI
jgi:outer membrane protein OmpA-like peptidoglycan-associated protein